MKTKIIRILLIVAVIVFYGYKGIAKFGWLFFPIYFFIIIAPEHLHDEFFADILIMIMMPSIVLYYAVLLFFFKKLETWCNKYFTDLKPQPTNDSTSVR